MLYELAIGDAFGAGYEFVSPQLAKSNDGITYRQHPRHKEITPGRYTDDTQRAIANAEIMFSDREPDFVKWSPFPVFEKYLEVFKRDPRTGYSGRMYKALSESKTAEEIMLSLDPSSEQSGAVMGVAPLGLYPNYGDVLHFSMGQAITTHRTLAGVKSAQTGAMAVHYFAYSIGKKSDLLSFLQDKTSRWPNGSWKDEWIGPTTTLAVDCLHAALTAVTKHDNMLDILKTSVAFSGDVDTVAAIALAIGSLSPEIDQNLPDSLKNGLENGTYGSDYLKELDTKLFQKFNIKPRS